jgi:hypothetical protein
MSPVRLQDKDRGDHVQLLTTWGVCSISSLRSLQASGCISLQQGIVGPFERSQPVALLQQTLLEYAKVIWYSGSVTVDTSSELLLVHRPR